MKKREKRILVGLLAAVLLFSQWQWQAFATVSGNDVGDLPMQVNESDWVWEEIGSDAVRILEYTGSEVDLLIPSSLGGKTVRSVGGDDKNFTSFVEPIIKDLADRESVQSVTIPDTVTSIGPVAFGEFEGLLQVDLGTGVREIGWNAFEFCTALESIMIPDSVISIGDGAFAECSSLSQVDLGTGVKEIGDSAFDLCTALESITIPDSVRSIGEWAFAECTSLSQVHLGAGLTEIGAGAFDLCTALESITIPNSVISIGEWAFFDCPLMTSVHIPSTVKEIGSYSFGFEAFNFNEKRKVPDFTIYGVKGSAAESYAKTNGFIFIEKADPWDNNDGKKDDNDNNDGKNDNNDNNDTPIPNMTEDEVKNARNTEGIAARDAAYNEETVKFQIAGASIATLRLAENEVQALIAGNIFPAGAKIFKIFELNPVGATRSFPNGIQVILDVPGIHAGQNLAVLHGIRDANGNITHWERLSDVFVGNGNITVTMTSFSPIAIVIFPENGSGDNSDNGGGGATPTAQASTSNSANTAPKTGQSLPITLIFLIGFVGLGVVVYKAKCGRI